MTRPDPAFAALLDAALYDQDPARRDGARSRIARTARGAQVEGLAALLDAPQRATRRRAARILSEVDPARARPVLRALLADRDRPARLRAAVARVLSVLADGLEPALAPHLTADPDPRVRAACATAAADPVALVAALADPAPAVVERAAAALEWIDCAVPDPAALRAALRAAAAGDDDDAADDPPGDDGHPILRLLARLDPEAPALAAAAARGEPTALDHLAAPAALLARLDHHPLTAWNIAARLTRVDAIDANATAADAIAATADGIDASATDSHAIDASATDSHAIDASASAPDASAPDASAPDASAPDASAPDASAPDAIAVSADASADAIDATAAARADATPAIDVTPTLITALAARAADPDPRVRAAAARALPLGHPALAALAADRDPGVAWLARRAAAGAYTPQALARRLGAHARSDAPSARPPYGLRPGDTIPRAHRAPAALAMCHPRFDINLGVAVRSAEAAGLREIYLVGRAELFRSPARGTDRILPLRHAPDAAALLRMARAADYQIVALQQTPDGVPFHRADYPPRPLFIVGAEDTGVPAPLRAAADLIVEIPLWGAIDSLNVAAAATTVLFHWRATREGMP